MLVLEKEIEAKLRDRVKRAGGLCLKWVCPGWAGVPDRLVLLPGGRVVFVELKRPKDGKLSCRQKWWRDKLTALGMRYCVIWDYEALNTFCLLEGVGA